MMVIVLTVTQFIPQVIKAIKTKKLKDISLLSFIMMASTASFWILHGIHRSDMVVVSANTLVLISILTIIILKIKYRK